MQCEGKSRCDGTAKCTTTAGGKCEGYVDIKDGDGDCEGSGTCRGFGACAGLGIPVPISE